MAILEPVHVMEMNRATTKVECVRVNPTRSFAVRGDAGMALYTWQNGNWFGAGGQQIPADSVPEEYRAAIRDNPVTVPDHGPEIVAVCEFCGETMNRSQKEGHLIAHVRATLGQAGTLPKSPEASAVPEPPPPAPTGPTGPRAGQRRPEPGHAA